jgi:hypothetical protein
MCLLGFFRAAPGISPTSTFRPIPAFKPARCPRDDRFVDRAPRGFLFRRAKLRIRCLIERRAASILKGTPAFAGLKHCEP